MNQMSNMNIKNDLRKNKQNDPLILFEPGTYRAGSERRLGVSMGEHANERYRGVTMCSSTPFCTRLSDYKSQHKSNPTAILNLDNCRQGSDKTL